LQRLKTTLFEIEKTPKIKIKRNIPSAINSDTSDDQIPNSND